MIDLRQGNCLQLMKDIPSKSIDMILCDLPYGVTNNKKDIALPFNKLWEQYERVIKDDGDNGVIGITRNIITSTCRIGGMNDCLVIVNNK